MPRGGRRPGAGRKPKPSHMRIVQGSRSRAEQKAEVPAESAANEQVEVLAVPDWLKEPDAIALWNELAPLALDRRTLTAATRRSLASLCEKHCIAAKLAAVELGGTAHARMLKQINAEMLQFNLTPCGKPLFEAVTEPAKKVSGLSRFRRG